MTKLVCQDRELLQIFIAVSCLARNFECSSAYMGEAIVTGVLHRSSMYLLSGTRASTGPARSSFLF